MTELRSGVETEVDPVAFAAAVARLRDKDGFHVVRMQGVAEEMEEHHAQRTIRVPAVPTQKCTACDVEKPLTAFYFVGRSGKRQSICGDCIQARAAAGREAAIATGKRRHTIGAEIQALMAKAPTSEGVTEDPAPATQTSAVSTASDPNAGSDVEEQSVTSSEELANGKQVLTNPEAETVDSPLSFDVDPDDWATTIEAQVDHQRLGINRVVERVRLLEMNTYEFSTAEQMRNSYFDLLMRLAEPGADRGAMTLSALLDRIESVITYQHLHELGEVPEPPAGNA